jgi:hypothetical protein
MCSKNFFKIFYRPEKNLRLTNNPPDNSYPLFCTSRRLRQMESPGCGNSPELCPSRDLQPDPPPTPPPGARPNLSFAPVTGLYRPIFGTQTGSITGIWSLFCAPGKTIDRFFGQFDRSGDPTWSTGGYFGKLRP